MKKLMVGGQMDTCVPTNYCGPARFEPLLRGAGNTISVFHREMLGVLVVRACWAGGWGLGFAFRFPESQCQTPVQGVTGTQQSILILRV